MDRIKYIRQTFYVDYPVCRVVNTALLQKLGCSSSTTTPPRNGVGVAAATTTSSASASARRSTPMQNGNQSGSPLKRKRPPTSSSSTTHRTTPAATRPQQSSFASGAATATTSTGAGGGGYDPALNSFFQMMQQQAMMNQYNGSNGGSSTATNFSSMPRQMMSDGLQPSFHLPSSSSAAAAARYPNNPWPPTPAATAAATSPPGSQNRQQQSATQFNKSSESMPHNPEEGRLLAELTQMGFPNRVEILEAIRRQPPEGRTADVVMMDMISHREEMEEAKKMDEARLMSEQDKDEQSRKLKVEKEEALTKANSVEALHRVFPQSWILEDESMIKDFIGNVNERSFMNECKKLLNFEKLSLQWYGSVLPKYYFKKLRERVFDRSKMSLSSSMKQVLIEKENEILQGALYKLEQQAEGGVPKVYLAAKKEAVGAQDNEVIEID